MDLKLSLFYKSTWIHGYDRGYKYPWWEDWDAQRFWI